MTHWRQNEFYELSAGSGQAWPISRNNRPISVAAEMPWPRWRVLLRRAARGLERVAAAIHIAIVAHKARRVQGALARLNLRPHVARRG